MPRFVTGGPLVALLCSGILAAAVAAADTAPVEPASPCREYAEWLCAEAKDTMAACVAMKQLEDLLSPATCRQALADRGHAVATLNSWRSECDSLVERLCTDIGPATATCRRLRDQRAHLSPDRCHGMAAEYATLIAQLRQEEARLHPLPAEVRARIEAPDAPSFGPMGAPVTLVMFSDFECPYCVQARLTAGAVFQQLGTRVRFVFRQMPLDIHPRAKLAARASLEAHEQGKFWPFHDALFANHEKLDRDDLVQRAREVGLDVPKFTAALDGGAHEAAILRDRALAAEAFVSGTPTLFIEGKRFERPGDYPAVLEEIQKLLPPAPTAMSPDAPATDTALAPAGAR